MRHQVELLVVALCVLDVVERCVAPFGLTTKAKMKKALQEELQRQERSSSEYCQLLNRMNAMLEEIKSSMAKNAENTYTKPEVDYLLNKITQVVIDTTVTDNHKHTTALEKHVGAQETAATEQANITAELQDVDGAYRGVGACERHTSPAD